jgi:thiamine biosynthesis lipoprotein
MRAVVRLAPAQRQTLRCWPLYGCFCWLLLSGCGERPQPTLQFSGATQGTSYHITVVPGAEAIDAPALQRRVEQRLAEIDLALSNYRDDSELAAFNRAPVGDWVELGPDLHEVLTLATSISWLSGGAFDVTVAPLVELWGFGAAQPRDDPPAAEAIAAARQRVGFQHLQLDLTAARARKQRDVKIDLSGVAQGFTVDRLAELLARGGLRNSLVAVGGALVAAGTSPRGTPWRIAIERPQPLPDQVQQAVLVSGLAISTSGDYRDYFERDGVRYSHTLDPVSGRPVQHRLASATVIAPTCAEADALATALLVLGPERGLRFAEQHGLAVYLIVRGGGEGEFEARYSKAFARYLN